MSSALGLSFSNGYCSARGPADLMPGELVRALGSYYKKGDVHPWKILGRTAFGTVSADTRIKGIALCQFDTGGTDKLIAYSGTTLYSATPGETGTFASLATGLNSSATTLIACHSEDRWYLGNGYDKNKKLKPDGTLVDAGMATPQTAPTVVASASAGSSADPTANSGSFTNPTYAYDSNDSTFASGTRSTAGTVTHTWSTWGASAAANRYLSVRWWLAGLPISGDSPEIGSGIGTGGTTSAGYSATVKLEKTEDGTNWTTLQNTTYTSVPVGVQTLVSNLSANSNLVQFRATLTYNSGTAAATLQIYTVKIVTGSTTTNFAITTGIYYAYTEYDQNEDVESPPSPISSIVTGGTVNQALVTFGTAQNTTATHWRVYRVSDGNAASITQLGLIATVPIAQTTYIDPFTIAASDAATPLVPQMAIGDLAFPRDTQAPAFSFMFSYNGSVCGMSLTNPRELRYSEAGRAESFPEVYVVSAFSLPEHDQLVCGADLGRTAVLFAQGAVLAIDGLPRVVDGQFEAADARPIKGHPGCVGVYAMTPFSVSGESRAAWVSPFGVYQTNGETCEPISLDLDWTAEVDQSALSTSVLEWDRENLILWFHFDNADGNRVTAPIHMAPTHIKQNGQPKWCQPTLKDVSCVTGGMIDSTYYRFSGHPTDGVVYLEESGYADEATGDAISQTIQTGQIDNEGEDIGVIRAMVNHSDWLGVQSGTITVTTGRDSASLTQTVAKSVSLANDQAHTIGVARAGNWVQIQFDHATEGTGRIGKIELEVNRQGRSGSANRWATSPAP